MSVMTIFVSHSHTDSAFADQLVAALRRAEADVWYDNHNLGLARIRDTIEREMRNRRVFIVVLSPAALASEWVQEESNWAYNLFRTDKSRVILPVVAEAIKPNDVWLFLQDFVRVEAHNATALPHEEAIKQTLIKLGLLLDQATMYPQEVGQAIVRCYRQHGCITGLLGLPARISLEQAAPQDSRRGTQGYVMPFEHGEIYWTETNGAHSIWWGVKDCFTNLGGLNGRLGFPVTDEIPAVDNHETQIPSQFQRFEFEWDYPQEVIERVQGVVCGATVYWSERHGAYATWGGIGEAYERGGGSGGHLGFPTSPEMEAAPSPIGTTGWYQTFEGGTIYWCPRCETRGGNPIHGDIEAVFHQLGGTRSRLGFPLTAQIEAAQSPKGTRGVFQRFEGNYNYPNDVVHVPDLSYGASIYWCETYGAQPIWGGIGEFYERHSGTGGPLGFPTSPEVAATAPHGTEGWYQHFEGGLVAWCPKHDGIIVSGPVLALYEAHGGCTGQYGFPMSAEKTDANGWHVQEFEGGLIGIAFNV